MTTEELEQIRKILREEIAASENRVKAEFRQEIKASGERLIQKIDASQEDTITVLKELIHTGYEMLEERIAALEKHTDLHNPKKTNSLATLHIRNHTFTDTKTASLSRLA